MATRQNGELAHELEQELFGEMESEFGAAHESHHEDELAAALHEDEFGASEALPEDEFGMPEAGHPEFGVQELGLPEAGYPELGLNEIGLNEFGLNEGEQFFGKIRKLARGVGRFVRKAAPVFKSIARVAVPMVAGAVGGPLGGMLGRVATQALGEDEVSLEDEFGLNEDEFGLNEVISHEALPEIGLNEAYPEATPESAHQEMVAEVMAEVAAGAQHEAEAEAMAGAAAVAALSAADRAALRRLLPHLVRGVAVLTRILRRQRVTRPAVRTIPTIVRQTVTTLRRRAAAGRPVNRRVAGQVMAAATRQVLTDPRACGTAIVRNLRTTVRAGRGPRPISG
jgi:hypothetical protein